MLHYAFNHRTGAAILRLPLGPTDYSLKEYNYTAGRHASSTITDFAFHPPSFVTPVLRDILAVNSQIKILLAPWSPPAALKTSRSLHGGSISKGELPTVVEYYAQTAKAWSRRGIPIWAMSMQNEPNVEEPYPSAIVSAATQNEMAAALSGRLGALGLGRIKMITHDNNYDQAESAYESVARNASAVDALAFHCYRGSMSNVTEVTKNLTKAGITGKALHLTECSGTGYYSLTAANRWADMRYWLKSVYFAAMNSSFSSVLVWNLALDPNSAPRLSAAVCDNCIGPFTIASPTQDSNAAQHVSVNLERYLMQHFSAATTNLTRWGGGVAHMVKAVTPADPQLSASNLACVTYQAFTAKWSSTSHRIGVVIENACGKTLAINIARGKTGMVYKAEAGLHTLIWTT